MNVLITGATGLLGSALLRSQPKGVNVIGSHHKHLYIPSTSNAQFLPLELKEQKSVSEIFRLANPQVVIHTAAKSSPDYCEKSRQDAHETNVLGTQRVIEEARKYNAAVFLMSSNQVFSGTNPPYAETTPVSPINEYGRQKVANEDYANKHKHAHIVRLMTMYGWPHPDGTKNSAIWAIEKLTAKEQIKVVDDVYNNFLWVGQAAQILWKMVKGKTNPKTLHIAGKNALSRYGFVREVAEVFDLDDSLSTPVPKSYFQDEAPRPLNTIYTTSLLEKIYKVKPLTVHEGLTQMKKEQKQLSWDTITI